ncbi:MAG: hypothetical protein PHW73_06515 [Atribacterota bacterium]|nr:hypothetical protein [Atribacterota bacterium]
MLVEVVITQESEAMIEDLRMHHVNAQLIIKEELDQTLPEYIECLLRGIWEEVGK